MASCKVCFQMRLRAVLLTVVLALLPVRALAQQTSAGFKAGTVFATWHGDGRNLITSSSGPDYTLGAMAGVSAVTHLSRAFSVQYELLYQRKGAMYRSTNNERVGVKVDYLEIPALLRFSPTDSARSITPFAAVGPSLSAKLSCRVTGALIDRCDHNFWDLRINGFDFGFGAGGGADISLGRTIVALEARYTFGLSSVTGREALSVRNGALALGIGLRFDAGNASATPRVPAPFPR